MRCRAATLPLSRRCEPGRGAASALSSTKPLSRRCEGGLSARGEIRSSWAYQPTSLGSGERQNVVKRKGRCAQNSFGPKSRRLGPT